MNKVLLGPLVRHILTALLVYWATRHSDAQEVVKKMMHGDTIPLWGGAWSVSLQQIQDLIVNAWPQLLALMLPIGLAFRARLRSIYAVMIARLTPNKMTAKEVHEKVSEAPLADKIEAVSSGTLPASVTSTK